MIVFVEFDQDFINLRRENNKRFLDIYRPGHKSLPYILLFELSTKPPPMPYIVNNTTSIMPPLLQPTEQFWAYSYVVPYLIFMGPDLINISKPTPQLFMFIFKQLLESNLDYRHYLNLYKNHLEILISKQVLIKLNKQEILNTPTTCEIIAAPPHFEKEQMDIIVDKWTEAAAKLKENNNVFEASFPRIISI